MGFYYDEKLLQEDKELTFYYTHLRDALSEMPQALEHRPIRQGPGPSPSQVDAPECRAQSGQSKSPAHVQNPRLIG